MMRLRIHNSEAINTVWRSVSLFFSPMIRLADNPYVGDIQITSKSSLYHNTEIF